MSLAKCVSESRPCKACVPAARYLVDQVRAGRTRSQAEAAYGARFSPDKVKNIELQDSPSKGPADAPVLIDKGRGCRRSHGRHLNWLGMQVGPHRGLLPLRRG